MKTLVLEIGPDGNPQYTEAFASTEERSSSREAAKAVEEDLRAIRKTREKAGLQGGDWKKGE